MHDAKDGVRDQFDPPERIERETRVTAGAPDRRRPMTVLPIAVTGTLRYLDVMRR
ncbi:hypothetical protein [Micromonospora globbae]|uniref:hypothetical protein n=1 Tax=Micromonospora globbae TaxID=1894969 RepID=UPI0037BAC601